MVQLKDIRHDLADALGMRKSAWDRVRDNVSGIDLGSYMPSRSHSRMPSRQMVNDIDTTSLVVGIVAGVAIGLSLGYLLKGNVKPAVKRVRQRAQELPSRLNITRMEEAKS